MPAPQRKPRRRKPAGRRGGHGHFFRWVVVLLAIAVVFGSYYYRSLWIPRWQAWHGAVAPAVAPVAPAGNAPPPAAPGVVASACGGGRLAVANLSDAAGAPLLHATAQSAGIAQLAALPRPAGVDDDAAAPRRAGERTVWRVPGELTAYQLDAAGSLELWLTAPGLPASRILAVIPAPRCTANGDAGDVFGELREDIGLRFGEPGASLTTLPQPVAITVTAPAFFSTPQAGEATSALPPNGVELRPVLNFTVP